jgi:hypothetical protein
VKNEDGYDYNIDLQVTKNDAEDTTTISLGITLPSDCATDFASWFFTPEANEELNKGAREAAAKAAL